MTSRKTSPSLSQLPRPAKTYRAGAAGARITWRDGIVTTLLPRRFVTFSRVPMRIEGRLYLVSSASHLAYEAPTLEPV